MLSIVSGSENRSLEPIVAEFCAEQGWACPMTYRGSVDIRLALADGTMEADAVWPAHSRWVEMGDRERRVKHLASIMTSPVVFAMTGAEADRLGFEAGEVTTRDLVERVAAGELEFIMTSATQSNSGFSAYLAMLTALAGSPEVLTEEMLGDPALRADVETLLGGVARTSGSSGWLRDLYLEGAESGAYYAMFNYEALVIEANRTLEERGLPTLQVFYPTDGVAVADSPLGFVTHADDPHGDAKEAFFQELQAHLLSDPVQAELLAHGRRTGFGGQVQDADPDIFRSDWGIDVESVLPAIRFPPPDVIEQALALYQEVLRRPSLLALCLDFSGSMDGLGESQLKEAVRLLFDPETSRRYLLQATAEDVFIAIPFSGLPWEPPVVAKGPAEAVQLAQVIAGLEANGGTDMYACAREAFDLLLAHPAYETHNPAVLLMTDGVSDGDAPAFLRFYEETQLDIPVFAITFGQADDSQLEQLAEWTRARVFDGREDLTAAFRHARGYN
ncbi:MAG: solute-binding protein [Alphaproteobacteria bacterium]|nr:solute-binding protein [Alphaproteobacteria bacterium]